MKIKLTSLAFIFYSLPMFAQDLSDLSFGSDSTFDIISWNMEWFPTNGQSTIDSMLIAIEALNADVIAVQEVYDGESFQSLIDGLDAYDGYYIDSEYLDLAYLYKNDGIEFSVDTIYQIFNTSSYNRQFPRKPLVLELTYADELILIINNHLKCCGDGYIDLDDEWDEETRRLDACNLLDQFVYTFHPDEKVIITGDMNDLIQESSASNVFQTFINDSTSYSIADMEIALGPVDYWSYPSWPSHLDHFILSNEFFDLLDGSSQIETIRIEDYLTNGFSEYENNMSDHRPVAMSFEMTNSLALDELNQAILFSVYPNPSHDIIYIRTIENIQEINIYSLSGQQVIHQLGVFKQVNISELSEGLYLIELVNKNKRSYQKILVQ